MYYETIYTFIASDEFQIHFQLQYKKYNEFHLFIFQNENNKKGIQAKPYLTGIIEFPIKRSLNSTGMLRLYQIFFSNLKKFNLNLKTYFAMNKLVLIFIVSLALYSRCESFRYPFWSVLEDINAVQKESDKERTIKPQCFKEPCSEQRVANFQKMYKWFKQQEIKYGKQNPFFRF